MGREFNREMGSYLRNRGVFRKTNPLLSARKALLSLVPKRKKQEVEQPLDFPAEAVEAVIAQDAIKQAKTPVRLAKAAAKPTVVHVEPREQPTKVNTFMKWFGSKREEQEDYEVVQQQPTIDEDVKEVLKITFKWLKRMDPDQVEEIKSSEDFEKYKRVLDKYGLIKK